MIWSRPRISYSSLWTLHLFSLWTDIPKKIFKLAMIVNLHLRGFTITMETLPYMSLWDCFQKSVTKEKWATPVVGSRLSKKERGGWGTRMSGCASWLQRQHNWLPHTPARCLPCKVGCLQSDCEPSRALLSFHCLCQAFWSQKGEKSIDLCYDDKMCSIFSTITLHLHIFGF